LCVAAVLSVAVGVMAAVIIVMDSSGNQSRMTYLLNWYFRVKVGLETVKVVQKAMQRSTVNTQLGHIFGQQLMYA